MEYVSQFGLCRVQWLVIHKPVLYLYNMSFFFTEFKHLWPLCQHPRAYQTGSKGCQKKKEVRLRGQPGLHPADRPADDPAVRGHNETAGKDSGPHAAHGWRCELPHTEFSQNHDSCLQGHPQLPLVWLHSCCQPKGTGTLVSILHL